LHTRGGRIAVEVELTLKSRTRLREIVVEFGRDYDQVWYFVPDRIEETLTTIAQDAPQDNVRVHRYAPIVAAWPRDRRRQDRLQQTRARG